MSEHRKPTHSIAVRTPAGRTVLELVPSEAFADRCSLPGLFRVRAGGKWWCGNGAYTFITPEAAGALAARLLAGVPLDEKDEIEDTPVAPYLPIRAEVRVHHGEGIAGIPWNRTLGSVLAAAHREIDGRWYVFVRIAGRVVKAAAEDVELVRR